jgi:hypothetical protein
MLTLKNTPNFTGIELSGDYQDLDTLYMSLLSPSSGTKDSTETMKARGSAFLESCMISDTHSKGIVSLSSF